MLPFYRDIYDHLVRVTDLAESYRDLIGGSLDAYLSVVSNRLNEIMSGQLKHRETIVDGFENTPRAFIGLFSGENIGKQIVRVV